MTLHIMVHMANVVCRSGKLLRESEQHMKDIVRVLEVRSHQCCHLFISVLNLSQNF